MKFPQAGRRLFLDGVSKVADHPPQCDLLRHIPRPVTLRLHRRKIPLQTQIISGRGIESSRAPTTVRSTETHRLTGPKFCQSLLKTTNVSWDYENVRGGWKASLRCTDRGSRVMDPPSWSRDVSWGLENFEGLLSLPPVY
ncbi:hypothetical protein TNCV_3083701 [Trichonephila clavipes]|nr:hypothetical protein TNCV_3083701 [Trichonephila clavipes]